MNFIRTKSLIMFFMNAAETALRNAKQRKQENLILFSELLERVGNTCQCSRPRKQINKQTHIHKHELCVLSKHCLH